MRLAVLLLAVLSFTVACGGEDASPPPTPVPSPVPVPDPAPEVVVPPPDPSEACARVIVVSFAGATAAPEGVTRSDSEAEARARALRARLDDGEDFATLARAESDAASSGPRGGLLGTYRREEFPEIHAPIRDAVFALPVGALSDPVRAPYGWVVAARCPVEKVHTRHLLIRYLGAPNAGEEITRSREEAEALARSLRESATPEGFEAQVREHSEDSSRDEGGDIGSVGRGLLQPEYEEAAFALGVGELSDVVETSFGFHIIQRLADE